MLVPEGPAVFRASLSIGASLKAAGDLTLDCTLLRDSSLWKNAIHVICLQGSKLGGAGIRGFP